MKRFRNIFNHVCEARTVLWVFPLLLIVPNLILCHTESMPWSAAIANVALPLGIYYLLMAWSPKAGRSILLFLPVIFFAAFQMVLLWLYGQSIIGVDMFLNMMTTNSGEVAELLDNLAAPLAIVFVLYVLPLIWAVVAIIKKRRIPHRSMCHARIAGALLATTGAAMTAVSYAIVPNYDMDSDLFPANVAYNAESAIRRTIRTNNYGFTSGLFRYDAVSTHDPDRKEVYVMVIGETGRAQDWQLFGYDRETTPRLCSTDSLIGFKRALTESNTTHKSVPMLMSTLSSQTFDSIYGRKCVISAFKEAGFRTAFLSMQRYNRSFIDFFGMEADTTDFIRERNPENAMLYDGELIERTKRFIESAASPKLLVVLHTYGSHFNYRERYPAEFAYFTPDNAPEASPRFRDRLVNAYDNSIRYTDYLLGDIIEYLDTLPDTDCAMIYASDHGEDIFDYGSGRFLHASPVPTYHQLHVPMVLWMSGNYRSRYPDKWASGHSHRNRNVSTSESMANTLLDLAGISTRYCDLSKSLVHNSYAEPTRVYLNDRNEAIPLRDTGIKKIDLELLEVNGLCNSANHQIAQSFPK